MGTSDDHPNDHPDKPPPGRDTTRDHLPAVPDAWETGTLAYGLRTRSSTARRALYDADELTPESHGAWLIRTRRTTHIVDLDARVYLREPDPDGQAFPDDRTWLRLNRFERWPRVGSTFLCWVEPTPSAVLEYWRQSSTIRAIMGTPSQAGPPDSGWPMLPDNVTPPVPGVADAASEPRPPRTPGGPIVTVGQRGLWHLTTMTADYVIDLDQRTITRTPAHQHPLPGDNKPLRFLALMQAHLGDPLVVILEPSNPHLAGGSNPISWEPFIRVSTPTLRIRPLT